LATPRIGLGITAGRPDRGRRLEWTEGCAKGWIPRGFGRGNCSFDGRFDGGTARIDGRGVAVAKGRTGGSVCTPVGATAGTGEPPAAIVFADVVRAPSGAKAQLASVRAAASATTGS
jgi:hypothetical protein